MIEPKQALIEEIQKIPIGVDVDAQTTRKTAIDFLNMMKDGAILPVVKPFPQGNIQGLKMEFETQPGYRILVIFEAGQKGAK